MPGFPGMVLIPLGRLSTSPIPLLARVALWFQHPHPRTGDIHGRPKRRDRDANPARRFGANTADLQELAAWLKKCRIKTIALESTGVYWIPLFELLESQGFEVNLVEPGQLSRCGARPKTDVLDAQWIQRLHSYGLLRASFRPPDSVLALRAYWRQRLMQVRYAASHVQHMQKALEQMNVKLTQVVSDITGLTGMSIIRAILDGERDPVKLAQLRDERCQHSEEQIALALQGTWRPNISSSFGRPMSCTSSIIGRSPSATSRSKQNWPISPTGRERRRALSSRGSAGARATTSGSTRRARCSRPWAWT